MKRVLLRVLLAGAVMLTLAGVTPVLADTYYFVKTYEGNPGDPYPWLEAEVMEVSSDSACTTPEGFTSVTLSELNDMGFDSPAEVYEAALNDSTAWPVSTPNGWHYANYFQRLSDPFMKRICCGSRIWRDWLGPMGLACKTWCRRNGSGQPYAMVREQPRIVRVGFGLNSYGRWAYPKALTMDWKQEGWFDDGNIQHQVYKVDFTTW